MMRMIIIIVMHQTTTNLDFSLLKVELADPEVQYIEADQVMSINLPAQQPEEPSAVVTQTGATWVHSFFCFSFLFVSKL